MKHIKNYDERVLLSLQNILNDVLLIKKEFKVFFIFDNIFATQSTGKITLCKDTFIRKNNLIQDRLLIIKSEIMNSLSFVNENIEKLFSKYSYETEDKLEEYLYYDVELIEDYEKFLKNKKLANKIVSNNISILKDFLEDKNKILNFSFLITMFDTQNTTNILNKLSSEELINSRLIFKIIDTYALHFEELKKSKTSLEDFINKKLYFEESINNLNFLNSILSLYKRKVYEYIHLDVKYKILLEYDNNIIFKKDISLNTDYLENIVACLIDHSCSDLLVKEFKKGKISKIIEIVVDIDKNNIIIEVTNNGFEVFNIDNIYKKIIENKLIIKANNFCSEINSSLEIESEQNKGMKYTIKIPIKYV